jgi:16S rRNA (guanine966-N2)-methyltransferase
MRIIGGSARGRVLATPKDDRVRPTTDRIRESLFSILGDFQDTIVLDGFAGTGALGCEALSRGATFCYFCDPSRDSVSLVEENLRRIDAGDRARVLTMRFDRALEQITHDPDVIFLDPPYGTGLLEGAVEAVAACQGIGKGALLVCEQGSDETPIRHDAFELDDERVYGGTRLTFLVRRG